MEELFSKSEVELESTLKKIWNTEELILVGKLEKSESPKEIGFGYITKPFINDRQVFYPTPVLKREVSIRVKLEDSLILGEYYEVSVKLAWLDLRKQKENPYLLIVNEQMPLIEKSDYLSPKEFIEKWFSRKGENPEDAATIARQLKLNELELYTHTKRFIFELIQNADDMPQMNRGVDIDIFLLENFLLFLHNGKFFDRDDVKAICDAAKSTKSKDSQKTGYKGIGFKSVFTDSYRVFIKSGSYSFKFDKKALVYNDFWDLYKNYYNGKRALEKKIFEKEYKGRESEYQIIDNIPWQIKPIWVNKYDYPLELQNTPFFKSYQVALALEVGAEKINDNDKNYHKMISELLNEPRFLLFLRNTRTFKYSKLNSSGLIEYYNIAIKKNNNKLKIIQNEIELATYLTKDFEIELSNKDFLRAGLNFQKTVKDSKTVFVDLDGKPLENIPEKLVNLEKTAISFAIKLNYNNIENLEKGESILFNYLPTSDTRFGFPFLVNSDFISKTDREFIQIENKWNHYLFYQIGFKLISWLAELAIIKSKPPYFDYIKTYLNLLPESLLDENNSEQGQINKSFNNGILEGLKQTKFILNSRKELSLCCEILIDNTGLTSKLGIKAVFLLKKINQTNKEFPFLSLDIDKLKKEYLEIEVFDTNKLKGLLNEEQHQLSFSSFVNELDNNDYPKLVEWLDSFVSIKLQVESWLLSLPFIKIKGNIFSINDIFKQNQTLFRYELLETTYSLFEKIGYSFTDIKIDDYDNLFAIITKSESYLNKPLLIYKKIEENQYLNQLTPNEKNQLLNFIKNLTGVNEVKFANTLKICSDNLQVLRPLNCLISNSCTGIPKWLDFLKISSEEENILDEDFKSYLISQDEILSKVFCHNELFEEVKSQLDLKNYEGFYAYILKLDGLLEEDKKPNYTTTKWLYIPSINEFSLTKQVYCPSSLRKIKSKERYEQLRSIIEKHTTLSLTVFESLPLITKLSLGCNENSIQKYLTEAVNLSLDEVNIFLDWIEEENEKDFLKNYQIYKEEDLSFSIFKSSNESHYYTNDTELIDYIDESNLNSTLVLFSSEIYSQKRKELGLLEGDTLTKYIITNSNTLTKDFVNFIKNTKEEDGLKLSFINKLSELCLFSDVFYDRNSAEHEILQILISLGKDKDVLFDSFIPKIQIDGHSINKKNISDNVTFQFDKTETEPKKEYQLKLSAILPNYKDETAALTMVVNNFIEVSNKRLLQAKVFKTQEKRYDEIFKEIHGIEDYLSPEQVIFLSLYSKKYPNIEFEDVWKEKEDFNKLFVEEQKAEYEKYCFQMLDLVHILNFTDFLEYFAFAKTNFKDLILAEKYCHSSEKLPLWMNRWMQGIDNEKKRLFLITCGLNDENSNIVCLRKGILNEEKDLFMIGLSNVNDTFSYSRTFEWLKELQGKLSLNLKKDYLSLIYEKISKLLFETPLNNEVIRGRRLKKIHIPILNKNDTYTLIPYDEAAIYHYRSAVWGEYDEIIFKSIISLSLKQLIVDDILPKSIRDNLKCIDQKPVEKEDIDELTDSSTSFKVPYYENWELKDKYPVFIFNNGEIPYKVFYNQIEISTFNSGRYKNIGGVFYISKTSEDEILKILSDNIPNSDYSSLDHKRLKYREQLEKEKDSIGKIEELTDEEIEELNLLLRQPLSDDEQQNQSILAIYRALKHYENLGHDVEYCKENFEEILKKRMLLNIDDNLNVDVRSAKGGMLYLRYHLWHKLDKRGIELFCITGKNNDDYEIFKSKEELANYNPDGWVFKLMTENKLEDINALFEGKMSKKPELLFSNLWIFIRVKQNMGYNSSFDNIFKNEYIKHNQPDWENDLD